VVNPGWGDGVQAAKAGLMEIGDVFVVNKADRDGTAATVHDLETMLGRSGERVWTPPVLETVATDDRGVDDLFATICRHRDVLTASGGLAERRERRLADEVRALVVDRLTRQAEDFCRGERFATVVRQVAEGTTDPYTAATLLSGGADRGAS
jgi:LAO/AO transport system kinase